MVPKVNVGQYTYEADAAVMGVMEDFYTGKTSIDQTVEAAQKQLVNTIQ